MLVGCGIKMVCELEAERQSAGFNFCFVESGSVYIYMCRRKVLVRIHRKQKHFEEQVPAQIKWDYGAKDRSDVSLRT